MQQLPHLQERSQNDVIRPSSSASMRDSDFPAHVRCGSRRGSVQSGYGSCEELSDQQPRKRAKLYRAEVPGKSDLNIERQPSSLRVAASTAASVRIHRPTPINPAISAAQNLNEEPVRPPTPISNSTNLPRRVRPTPSLLRESSFQSTTPYTSPYPMSDDQTPIEHTTQSPEESRYQGLFEPSFSMPSSPPVLDYGLTTRSSPVLPPMTTDRDSGFMSGGIEDLLDDEIGTPLDDCTRPISRNTIKGKRTVRSAIHPRSPTGMATFSENQPESYPVHDGPFETQQQPNKEVAPAPTRAPTLAATSRPSSRASVRQAPKPLAPAPISQSELEQLLSAIPTSDPVMPHGQSWGASMDLVSVETPAPQPISEDGKVRSGAGARRLKQVQARLEKCIRDGQVPPYCENCGAIETPTWRRAHSKEITGSEEDANELTKDPTIFFWLALGRDDEGKVTKFKIYKKTLVEDDKDFAQVLLCNPCGLWLHKFKTMRPENKWNKAGNNKKKRPPRNRRNGGPLSTTGNAARSSNKSESSKPDASSPGASDASSPAGDEGATPTEHDNNNENKPGDNNDAEKNDEIQEPSPKRRRANSLEPRKSSDTAGSRWQEENAMEALRRAIQSSPARNLDRSTSAPGENNLTPKPVRRVLFPNSQAEGGHLKALGESVLNSPRRSPRNSSTQESDKQSGGKENQSAADLVGLFDSPSFEFDVCSSPTPRRRNQRVNAADKRHSLPFVSPLPKTRKDTNLDSTPTRLTAQRLQRVQSSPVSASRHNQTPKRPRSRFPDLPLSDDVFGPDAFQGMDNMIVDIFSEDAASAVHTDPLFPFDSNKCASENWTDWLPSDYVSPTGSDKNRNEENSTDIINALLSDPDIQKDIFQYTDSNGLDSGFFSSDSLSGEGEVLGDKGKALTNETITSKEQI
ncbi:hypothetical protein AOCH_001110 [Aspergillus ochraceoroseus]|nr:hypothetical protein AOCH_001110 [Aspergillus ochraceoroseus]